MHTKNLATDHSQRVSSRNQITGKEHDQRNLGQLTWLKSQRTNADPKLSTVDVATNQRQHRRNQQRDANHHGDEHIASKRQVAFNKPDDRAGRSERNDGPDHLLDGKQIGGVGGLLGQVESIDFGDAEPVKKHTDWQQQRIGLAGLAAQNHVNDQRCQSQRCPVGPKVRTQNLNRAQLNLSQLKGVDAGYQEQQRCLDVATSRHHPTNAGCCHGAHLVAPGVTVMMMR